MVREFAAGKPEQPQFEQHEFYFISRALARPKFSNKPNEDSFFNDTERSAYGVFDGMGGHEHSEVASQLACTAVQKFIAGIPAGAGEAAILQTLHDAYESANGVIRHEAMLRHQAKLGTTATTVLFRSIDGTQRAFFAHMGDSRLYRFRKGVLDLLTTDHGAIFGSLKDLQNSGIDVQKLARQVDEVTDPSKISDPLVAALYEKRNKLTRYIGQHDQVNVEVGAVDVEDADVYILTTDGWTDNLTHSEIEKLAKENHNPAMLVEMIEGSAQQIVRNALKRGEIAVVDGGGVEIKKRRTSRAKMDDMTGVVIAACRIG